MALASSNICLYKHLMVNIHFFHINVPHNAFYQQNCLMYSLRQTRCLQEKYIRTISKLHLLNNKTRFKIMSKKWTLAWVFQQFGMWVQQRLRPACAYAQTDQCLCLSLEYSMSVKLLIERHLQLLSLQGGCTGSSESTLVKIPHWRKSRVTAQMFLEMPSIECF